MIPDPVTPCKACGAPMLTTRSRAEGWALRCPHGCGMRPVAAPPEDGDVRAAGELAASGLGWYRLAWPGEADLDRAEAAFHRALALRPGDAALAWAELLCRYGVRVERADGESVTLLCRFGLAERRLGEDADFARLLDAASGTGMLSYFRDEARKIDRLLEQCLALRAEPGCDVFVCLKTEEGGAATPEKRFGDALVDQLARAYGVERVFYAPRALAGLPEDAFEASIHRALETARLMVVLAGAEARVNAPWVRSEWGRFFTREDARALICCLGGMAPERLPDALSGAEVIRAADEGKAGSVAGRVYRLLTAAPELPKESPESLFARGRELLSAHPGKAVALLRRAAEEKHAPAQMLLGRCFERGAGVQADLREARRWYLSAAGRGVAGARTALDALKLRADAERGSLRAQAALGALYMDGAEGVEREPGEALRWLRPAAEAGDVDSLYRCGRLLVEAGGDEAKVGRRMLAEARRQGSAEAAAYLKGHR